MWWLLTATALATPGGSAYQARITPVCTTDEAAIFLVVESDHDGTYYGSRSAVRWLRWDASGWRALDVARVHSFRPLDPGEPARPSKVEADVVVPGLPGWLDATTRCEPPVPRGHLDADIHWEAVADGIGVRLGDVSRMSSEARWWRLSEVGAPPVPWAADARYPHFDETGDCPLTDPFRVQVGDRVVVGGGVPCGLEGVPWVLVDLAATDEARIRASVLNQRGLDLHRAGKHALAADHFAAATRVEPTNETARFNLACAFARQGLDERAVATLRELAPTAALAAKIAKDTDFDGIRDSPALKAFLASLR